MSKPNKMHKRMPKKALPNAPNRRLPPGPNIFPETKPRAQSYDKSQTTSTATYTTTYSNLGTNGTNAGFTYTTTYLSESHPWAQPAKPLKKLPNKIPQKTAPQTQIKRAKTAPNESAAAPSTTISFTNVPSNDSNTSYTMLIYTNPGSNNKDTNTRSRAMTYNPHLTYVSNNSKKDNNTHMLQHNTQPHHQAQGSYHKALPLNHDIVNMNIEYSINDHVDLNDNRQGIIRFIGEISVELHGAIWYGIQLTEAKGTNNGTLKGVTYFKCAPHYGSFVERKRIRWLSSEYSVDVDLDSKDRFHIHQLVGVKGKNGSAEIRFIGLFQDELKYGVELLDDTGTHSGVIGGKFYYSCGIYRGLFVNEADLIIDDEEDEEQDTYALPMFNRFGKSAEFEDSVDSDTESICSMSSIGDGDIFGHIRLDEGETDMAFTQILNKFKHVERGQVQTINNNNAPRPSVLDIPMDADEIQLIMRNYSSNQSEEKEEEPNTGTFLTLQSSKTSLVKTDEIHVARHSDIMALDTDLNDDMGCVIDDDEDDAITPNPAQLTQSDAYHIQGPPRRSRTESIEQKKMSVVVTDAAHAPHNLKNRHTNELGDIAEEEYMEADHDHAVPSMIKTQASNTRADAQAAVNSLLSPLMTPASGKSSNMGSLLLSPNHSLQFSEFIIDEEACHLKKEPEGPYDVCTTGREFANTAQIIQLGCNNPYKLFKILKAMTCKLYSEEMKYRILSTESNRLRVKLLNYDGVEEFLKQIGFVPNDNDKTLECDLDQPPISVLNAAMKVLNDFISKSGRRRAIIDGLKKFNPSALTPITAPVTPVIDIESIAKQAVNDDNDDDDDDDDDNNDDNDDNESEEDVEESIEVAISTEIEARETTIKHLSIAAQSEPAIAKEAEAAAIEATLDAVYDAGALYKEEEDELELEDDEDTFQLKDIIASITHEDNNDYSARQIILLCYVTFTDSLQLFQCLNSRYSECNSSNIRNKVVAFIESWMKQYWNEDWNDDVMLLMSIESFCKKTQTKYAKTLNEIMEKKRKQNSDKNDSVEKDIMSPIILNKDINAEIWNEFDTNYDFLKINNSKIARQITYLDMKYFSAIKPRECLGQAWKKKNKYQVAPNICENIDHFNRASKWVQCRILLAKSHKIRARIIKKFIKICEELFRLRNFNSLYAIYGALNSSTVMRLKKAWRNVSTKHLAKFEEFKVIFASKKNMGNLRKLHRETYPPMIPYTGIILQDLMGIEEVSKMEKTRNDLHVNFAKLIRLSTVIDSILNRQQAPYQINVDNKLQTLIKNEMRLNQNLSDDHIWKLSDKAKNNDEKKKKNFIFGAK